ncbi:hypothetical protein H0H92_004541 [Tricholoma furcatifolium]|nr:hypothetical protein H0H92_004541 [Tricholoma furcatifolium]
MVDDACSDYLFDCPSCCPDCIATSPQPTESSDVQNPYALNKLLPLGTVTLYLDPAREGVSCNHKHAEDGWHPFEGSLFFQRVLNDNELCREIDYLVQHRFISVNYRLGTSTEVVLRIYIIPHDLPNVQGRLRIRKKEILRPARRSLRKLLPKVVQDQNSWWHGSVPSQQTPNLFPNYKDRRTLAEIYGDLKSPNPTFTTGFEDITKRLLDFSDPLAGFGMRSSLYNYQRRSVATMLQRELDPSDVPDPLFLSLKSMTHEVFYLQPGTMEVLRERPTAATSQSGILCEELGTGKTVIVLALVLSTLNQLSAPEPSIVDERPILTPLSLRHFPSTECVAARNAFRRRHQKNLNAVEESHFPTLVELLLHRRRTTPDTCIYDINTPQGANREGKRQFWASCVEELVQGESLQRNIPFYHHYEGNPSSFERSPRAGGNTGPRVMYLTSATLIIVPANLLSQWDREIQKHCEVPLRVLILRTGTQIPCATSLASDYDIILMTYTRFTAENKYNNVSKLHSWETCRCPCLPGSRVPNCKCTTSGVSPLLQVRWKRLVIDEGHISASISTILTPFTKLLSVERRWIVTGTPTRNLLGLSLGENSSANAQAKHENAEVEDDDSEMDVDRGSPSSSDFSNIDMAPPRVWTKDDREDLSKLSKMISHFIAIPQFTASPKLLSSNVIEPLLDPLGPQPGAIQVLIQVMESIMIRHRIEDVEKEVVLPPMLQEAVLLDMDPFAVKSYNAMQAALAINAVDSQRTDQNVDALQNTVKNMSQAMFWSSDDSLFGVEEMLKNSQVFKKFAVERNAPPEDMALLEEALSHIKLAADDPLWRSIQSHEDVPYRVTGLRRNLFNAWTRMPRPESGNDESFVGLIHTDRLLRMQDCIIRHPLISQDMLIKRGEEAAANDALLRQLFIESQKGKQRKSSQKVRPHQEEINAGLKVEDAAKRARDPGSLKEMKEDLNVAMNRLNEDFDDNASSQVAEPTLTFHGGSILSASLLGSVRIGPTASSKLNYIINEILQHAAHQKFLIFSDSPLTLAHVSEALELMHVKFLRFTTQIPVRLREQMVLTFETSEKYRVFLMELKHGARGLNLISASRVIFCEPVWQADVESQAIKRAHRIGQTQPITVKTLAIRGTAEENMVARRNALKGSHEKVPKLIEESGMRHFIANPRFINYPSEKVTVDMPLLTVRPADDTTTRPTNIIIIPPLKRVRPMDPIDTVDPSAPDTDPTISLEDVEPPRKKRLVRFAVD